MHKLKLVKVGKHKIQVVKLIRMFTQLGLKESKELMDNAPSILISHRVDISLKQIIKNFAAIGAIVEKVQEEKKNKPKDEAIGPDEFYSTDRPGIAKQEIKDYQKVNIKTKTVKTYNSDYQKVENKKLNLKPAIFFATIVAVIKSFANLYFGYYATFYAIFIVAIALPTF
jgi:hypothetical protein